MTQRASERDYSQRTLFEKLGVTSDAHVAISPGNDPDFVEQLNAQLAKAASQALRTKYDLIFVRIDAPQDLPRIPRSASHLKPNGALWVIHPKGRSANPTDADVRAIGISAGLVDNKISAYDDSHTATRYVIPVKNR